MILYKKGDLFETELKIIAHGCNCSGGFGSGVAKIIASKYPEAKIAYLNKLKTNRGWRLGDVQIVNTRGKIICNCATQERFGYDGRKYVDYEAIKEVMFFLKRLSIEMNETIAIPKIGAGLAGGDWNVIEKIINEVFQETKIVVYEL